MEIIIGLLLGVVFFIATISAYTLGIKHGRIVKHDGIPNINPIGVLTERKTSKEIKQQHDEFMQGLQNILNFGESFDMPKKKEG